MTSQLPIVLMTAHPAHRRIVESLRAHGGVRVVLLDDREFAPYMQESLPRAQSQWQRTRTAWEQGVRALREQNAFAFSGQSLAMEMAVTLDDIVTRDAPHLLVLSEAFSRLEQEAPIKAIVIHEDVTPSMRLLIALAAQRGIPSLHLPHGIEVTRLAIPSFDDVVRASLVAAVGEHGRDFYLSNPDPRNEPEKFVLVGRSEWDDLYGQPLPAPEPLRAKLGLDSQRKVIGFAGSWGHEQSTIPYGGLVEERFRSFLRAARRMAHQVQVVVRPHPSSKYLDNYGEGWYQAIAHEERMSVLVPQVAQEAFLAVSDLIVSLDSTFATVALIVGRPSLSITTQNPGTPDVSGYDSIPAIATCKGTVDSIERALRNCLFDAEYRSRLLASRDESLNRLNFRNDGHATERVVQLILSLVKGADSVEAAPPFERKASIVIPLYNKVEYTEQCLEALINNTPDDLYEVILVDNASSDGTAELLASLEGDVQVIRNSENMGFARACNQGAALARGKYIIVLNNDTLPQPGWLEALIAEADSDPNVGIVGCKLLYPDTGKVQHAGIGWIDGLPDHPFRHADAQAPEVIQVRDLDMVTGACMLIRRDLFALVGGFDEGFLNGGEDIDLCLQVRRAGFRVRYTPESVLYHHEGVSEGRFAHVTPNLQRFFRRWEGCFDSEGRFMPPSKAVPVRWEGSQFVYHSLAHVNRELCRELIASGTVDLEIIPYEPHQFSPDPHLSLRPVAQRIGRALPSPAAVHVRHQWPPRFDPPAEGAWVMIQPWEFGGLPADWIAPMRDQVDEIWVYTSWLRDCYLKSGIPAEKVHVVPLGVDTALYQPEGATFPLKSEKRFKFLFLGGAIGRKGIDILLETYLATFTASDDVCLVIKTNGANSHYRGASLDAQIKQLASNPMAPAIEFIDQDLSDFEIAALYRACDALVHPYRGEGFGLPIAEAMASGLPVIVTGYGACLDFCDAESAYLIAATEVPLVQHSLPDPSIGYWMAEPDRADLARLMLEVIGNPDEARAVGARGRERIVSKFQWAHVAQKASERISELADRAPIRFAGDDPFRPGRAPLQLEERRDVTFFHHPNWSGEHWKEIVIAYSRAFSGSDDVSLVLWLDPTQSLDIEEVGASLMAVLASDGGDPEQTPDILLVSDALDLEGLACLYAAADSIVPADDREQAARARRMEIPVLASLDASAWHDMVQAVRSKKGASCLNSTHTVPK